MVSSIKSSLAFLLKARLQTGHREASGIQERRWPFAGSKGRVLILATHQLFGTQGNNGDLGTWNTSSGSWKQDSTPGK